MGKRELFISLTTKTNEPGSMKFGMKSLHGKFTH